MRRPRLTTCLALPVMLVLAGTSSLSARAFHRGGPGTVFSDDLESGDTCAWSTAVGLPTPMIPFGTTVQGEIGLAGEIDAYSFCALAGDEVVVRMVDVSGSLLPEVRVFRPDGSELCGDWSGTTAEVQCSIDSTGSHTILAGDLNGTATGSYGFHVQLTNSPGNATGISWGDTLAGSLAAAGQIDAFVFSASVGDEVVVRMVDVSGSLLPEVRVFRPDGSELCGDWSGTTAEVQCSIDSTGSHTILTGDLNGTATGSYGFHVQLTNSPGNATGISLGDTLAGSLAAAGQIDAFVFSASVGDEVLVRMVDVSGSLLPEVRVFRPDGSELCGDWSGTTAEVQCSIDSTGSHTILAGDLNGTALGDYSIHLAGL